MFDVGKGGRWWWDGGGPGFGSGGHLERSVRQRTLAGETERKSYL
jgi:hypothetical protein